MIKNSFNIEEGQKLFNIQLGETIEEEVTPKDFGSSSSNSKTSRYSKNREAERNNIIEEFGDKEGYG